MTDIILINKHVFQNDILHVLVKNYSQTYFELLTAQIIGILDCKEGEIKILESIPVALKVKDTLSKNMIISIFLPYDVLPSYQSENYTIQYFFVLNSMNQVYKKIDFWVHKTFDEYINYVNVKIIEQDFYYIFEIENDGKNEKTNNAKENMIDLYNTLSISEKQENLDAKTNMEINEGTTLFFVWQQDFLHKFDFNCINSSLINDLINVHNKEEYFRYQFYKMFDKITQNVNEKEKLEIMERKQKEIDNTKIDKYFKYKNNLQKLKKNIKIKINQNERTFSVKQNENVFTEIKIEDVFYTSKNNKIEIKYSKNIRKTKILIKRIKEKIEFGLDFECVIFEKNFNTDFCVKKIFSIFLEDIKNYTMNCFYFTTSFVVVILLDDNEIELPIKIEMSKK